MAPQSEASAFVFACGAILTSLMYLALRRVRGASIRARLALSTALALLLAGVLSVMSFCIWFHVSPDRILAAHPPPAVTLRKQFARSFGGHFVTFFGWAAIYLFAVGSRETRLAEKRLASIAIEKRDAELTALRYQLNPHFLFNALNSISALVQRGDGPAAEAAIDMLSSYLRTSLTGNDDADTPLEDELERARLYLAIEKVRFGHRLAVRWKTPQELGAVRLPSLLLQPLVENVVRHAVAATDRTVTMEVSAFEADGSLHLVVDDDGPGHSPFAGHGIGLENVRARLASRYDGRGGLSVGPGARGGFRAELLVPLDGAER